MARILVIEDEANIARAVRDRLKHEGHQVESALSGPTALAWLASNTVDLIILDVLMPDMDGFEVIGRLKADSELRKIPVLILTVLADDERLRRTGADAFMAKPYKNADLIRTVNEVLERSGAHTGEAPTPPIDPQRRSP